MKDPTQVPPAGPQRYTGTPTEVGGQIWSRLCLPAVGRLSHELTPLGLGELYGGFTLAAWGAMVADFGHEQAIAFARQMLARFEQEAPTLTEDGSTGAH